jgi:hypothetical protein
MKKFHRKKCELMVLMRTKGMNRILENYREQSHITNIRKHVSFYISMPLKRARRVSELEPEKSISPLPIRSKPAQNQVSEEVKPNAMQGKKAIQKAAIANRFSNVPRNLGPGVGHMSIRNVTKGLNCWAPS